MGKNFMERQIGKQLQYHVLKNVTEVCMIAMRPQREHSGLPDSQGRLCDGGDGLSKE